MREAAGTICVTPKDRTDATECVINGGISSPWAGPHESISLSSLEVFQAKWAQPHPREAVEHGPQGQTPTRARQAM